MCSNTTNRNNLIALILSWSASAFTFYFIEFYMKLVPFDNAYLLMILIGVADLTATTAFYFITKAFKDSMIANIHAKLNQIYFSITSVTGLILYLMLVANGSKEKKGIYALFIFVMRFFSGMNMNMSYFMSS